MSHKKFGPDRFSRFDVYWIQIDRQTNKQTDKPNLYIDCSVNEIIPENPQFKNQKSTNTVIPTMSRVLRTHL